MKALSLAGFKRASSSEAGAAVVEFALLLTLLITLVAGIFEFGRAFWYYDALTKATRDGARFMSVTSKDTIASTGVGAAKDLIVTAARNAGIPSFLAGNVDVVCLDASFNDSVCTDGTAPGGIRVQASYPMTIGQFIPFLLGGSMRYAATLAPHTTMRYML